mgnify:CR=1 FL=1
MYLKNLYFCSILFLYLYEGYFKNDVKEGEGKLTYVSGDVYQGSWKTDRASGFGVLKYRSGDTYTGHFVNGVKSGDGILQYKNHQEGHLR